MDEIQDRSKDPQRLHGKGVMFMCISEYKTEESLFHWASPNGKHRKNQFKVPKEITTQEFKSQSYVCFVRSTGYMHCPASIDTTSSKRGATL